MEILNQIVNSTTLIANIFTTIASAIAIGVFFAKRKELYGVFKILLNFSFQTTIHELKNKLERLNNLHAAEPTELEEIKNILHDIAGQIRGNPILSATDNYLSERIIRLAVGKSLTEPKKRALVSEIREILRNCQINSTNLDLRG